MYSNIARVFGHNQHDRTIHVCVFIAIRVAHSKYIYFIYESSLATLYELIKCRIVQQQRHGYRSTDCCVENIESTRTFNIDPGIVVRHR